MSSQPHHPRTKSTINSLESSFLPDLSEPTSTPVQGKILEQSERHSSLPRSKLFWLTWLAIYPLITLIFLLFGDVLALLPLPLRTLVLTGSLVYLMTYWLMPMLMKLFAGWLH